MLYSERSAERLHGHRGLSGLGRRLLCAVAVPVMMLAAAPSPAGAQTYLVTAGKPSNIVVPDIFVTAVKDAAVQAAADKKFHSVTNTDNVTTVPLIWPSNADLERGSLYFNNGGNSGAEIKVPVEKDRTAWNTFVAELKKLGRQEYLPHHTWHSAKISFTGAIGTTVTAADVTQSSLPTYRGESSGGLALRVKMATLQGDTTSGTHFPATQVPKNLATLRTYMLQYANSERKIANFRKNAGATKDLHIHNKQRDLVLNDHLSKAAQWFAEYLASEKKVTHAGPTGMVTPAERVKALNPGVNVAYTGGELAGRSEAAGCPYCWIAGDTHYSWWFNEKDDFSQVGFGAAKGTDGNWYYVAVGK